MSKKGRPKKEFDLGEVERLGSIGATYEEMASWFDTTTRTIERRMAEEEGGFCRAYKKGMGRLKMSLRRKQLELANSGNPTMLIWLGKQMLDQKERSKNENEIELKDVTPTINLIAKKPDSE